VALNLLLSGSWSLHLLAIPMTVCPIQIPLGRDTSESPPLLREDIMLIIIQNKYD